MVFFAASSLLTAVPVMDAIAADASLLSSTTVHPFTRYAPVSCNFMNVSSCFLN